MINQIIQDHLEHESKIIFIAHYSIEYFSGYYCLKYSQVLLLSAFCLLPSVKLQLYFS